MFLMPMWFFRWPAQGACACFCTVLFAVLGGILLGAAAGMHETVVSYKAGDVQKSFTLDEEISGKVLIHYELPEVYVNQKRFIESQDSSFLGGFISKYVCTDAEELEDVRWRRCPTGLNCSADSVISRAEAAGAFRPCGLVSLSMFTDVYELTSIETGESVTLDQSNLALPADDEIFEKRKTEGKLKDGPEGGPDFLVADTPSWLGKGDFFEHFKVWWRTSPSPHVRHLWATNPGPLKKGRYELRFVENGAVWTESWNVPEKRVVISGAHDLGSQGACQLLGAVCVFFCCIQASMAISFLVLPKLRK